MYLPAFFESRDPAHALRIMREHPLATLISTDEAGLPYASHLPLHAVLGAGASSEIDATDTVTCLLGHCAKPNPHWRYLADRPKALVTFMGPSAYMSPKVYPDLAHVPTWNYVTVHAEVTATLLDGDAAKDAVLKQLIADHEPGYAQQWRDLGEDYQHKMLAGIVAFELRIDRLQCKLKLNQHRPAIQAAMLAAYDAGTPTEQALAVWMRNVAASKP